MDIEPKSPPKQRIGFLWETPDKPCEHHIRRQVLGSREFEPLVLTRSGAETARLPARVVRLERQRNRFFSKVYRKYVLRAPHCVYNHEVDALPRTVREHDVRLLHVFFGHKAIRNLLALHLLDIPVTVSFHGVDVSTCANTSYLSCHLRELFSLVAAVFPRSRHMADELADMGCPASKLWINRAGIPLDQFPYAARHRRPGEPPVLLQVCRLVEKKGLHDTLAAFELVRARVPDAQLRIAGEGELARDLGAEIERRGLQASVRLLGMLEPAGILQELRRAHVFVHPSVSTSRGDHEGIPNSLLEAMATGLPVVSTRHAGIPEAITDGHNGWLVDEHEPAQLAERILWMLAHPDELDRAAVAARRTIEENYSLSRRMELLDRKYVELIRTHRPPKLEPLRDVLRKLDLVAFGG